MFVQVGLIFAPQVLIRRGRCSVTHGTCPTPIWWGRSRHKEGSSSWYQFAQLCSCFLLCNSAECQGWWHRLAQSRPPSVSFLLCKRFSQGSSVETRVDTGQGNERQVSKGRITHGWYCAHKQWYHQISKKRWVWDEVRIISVDSCGDNGNLRFWGNIWLTRNKLVTREMKNTIKVGGCSAK